MKNKFKIKINTVDRVNKLVDICLSFPEDIDIKSGKYIIDAKSIMGILSFDLTKELTIHINSDDINVIKMFNEKMNEFKL